MRSALANEAEAIAQKIKRLEALYEPTIDPTRPYVLRLDGVAFRSYTAKMAKPFDMRFSHAMLDTCVDLLDHTTARTGFVQSDEMTLVFPPDSAGNIGNVLYSGRVQKIASVLASMASARFNHHISSSTAWFDARVFAVPDETTAMEALYWRHKFDCRRNAVNSVGVHLLSHQTMHNLPMSQVLAKLSAIHAIDPFKHYSPLCMYGSFLKRIQYPHVGFNPVTNEHVPTVRTKIEARSFDWDQPEEDRIQLVFAKYWEPDHPKSLDP